MKCINNLRRGIVVKCTSCGSEEFQCPEVPCALEQWVCLGCGTKVDVHCNYLPSQEDLANIPRNDRFRGSITLENDYMRLKALLKLKHSLEFAERFSAASLEAQYRSGSLHWDLGEFFDFELERAEVVCKKAGVNAKFCVVAE